MMRIIRELLSLFVDDGAFALGIVLWLAALWIGANLLHVGQEIAAVLLFLGLAALLVEAVLRAARRS